MDKKPYVVKSGVHGQRDKGDAMRMFQPGDVMQLTDAQAALMGLSVEPAPSAKLRTVAAKAEPEAVAPPAGADHKIHGLTIDDARTLVSKTKDVAELDELDAAEHAHPKYQGGRAGVLSAIERRRADLDK